MDSHLSGHRVQSDTLKGMTQRLLAEFNPDGWKKMQEMMLSYGKSYFCEYILQSKVQVNLPRYQAPDECRRRTVNSEADEAIDEHLDKGPGSPNLAPLGEEPTSASQQAGTNANVDKCDSTGATSSGTMNSNNARDASRETSSSMNDAGPETSSIPTVTVDLLTNAPFPSPPFPSPPLPSPLPPVANADSGFGHAATEQLFATSNPTPAALTNLSELSQHQDHDLSSLVAFNKDFHPQPMPYQMLSDAWFNDILSSLPPMAQGPTSALQSQSNTIPDGFSGPTVFGHAMPNIPETSAVPTTLPSPPTSNLHPFELPFLEQGMQPDTTVQDSPLPNAGTLLFLPDASLDVLQPSPGHPSLAPHSKEASNPVESSVKVAGQAGRGRKRKGNKSELDDEPGTNQDSALTKGRGKRRRNRNEVVAVMDMVVTAADGVSMGAAVTETRSRRMSNLPAHLREAGYSAPKRGKRVKT